MLKNSILKTIKFFLITAAIFSSIATVYAESFEEYKSGEIGYYNPDGLGAVFEDIDVVSNIAYIADAGLSGLRILNVSDPTAPSQIGYAILTMNAYNVKVSDNVAFVREGSHPYYGLKCFDVSNPAAPTPVGDINYTRVNTYQIIGDILYLSNGTSIKTVNISDLDNPIEIDSLELNRSASIYIENNYIYAATSGSQSEFNVINAADLNNLSLVASIPLGNSGIFEILPSGNVAYLTGRDYNTDLGFLKTVNIADKENPVVLSSFETQGISTVGIVIIDSVAYLGDAGGGLLALNISSHLETTAIGYFDDYKESCTGTSALAQFLDIRDDPTHGKVIFIAAMGCGMRCIAIDELEFEVSSFNIPGPSISLSILVATIPVFFLLRKIKCQKM